VSDTFNGPRDTFNGPRDVYDGPRDVLSTGGTEPVEELFPGFTTGRTFSWANDPSDFQTTGYLATTDNARAALVMTGSDIFEVATALTVVSDISHCRIKIIYRAQPRPGLNLTNIGITPVARYSANNTNYNTTRVYGDGNASLSLHELIAGSDENKGALGDIMNLDNTDSTHDQHILYDNFWDVGRAKWWFASNSEPNWMGVPARFRPYSGWGGGPVEDLDNIIDSGRAGLIAQFGGIIYDIIITELIPISTNIFPNAEWDSDLLDSFGRPFFVGWDPTYANQAGVGLVEKVTITGPQGTPVNAFRVARDAPQPGHGGGPMIIYDIGKLNAPGYSYTRVRPFPYVNSFLSTMPTKVWTKANGIDNTNANQSDALSARWVNYYYNTDGSKSNVTENVGGDYHWAIGPNNGRGTWDWTLTQHNFVMHSAAEMNRNTATLGLHDETAFGELFIYFPEMYAA
jgi:hypothetical protein